jgi:hypothetical protein
MVSEMVQQKTTDAEQKQQKDGKIKSLIEDVLKFGDMLLIANKGIGKTNALMVLAQKFRELQDTKVIIFEDFPKFALEFDALPYFIVKDSDVTETSHTVDVEDYFLRHERDYSVKRGSEIQEFLEKNKDCIFTIEISDIERSAFFIYSVVQYFYRKHYLRKFKNYSKTERIVFVIEESQNVFDSSTISKKIFNRLRKIFSVARNLDLHFVLASQRLQDLNTKIRGRTRLLLGQVSIDDWELKIRRLLRNSKYKTEILNFERGKFLYTANDTLIQFPKFEANGKPYQWQKPKPKETEKPQKKRGILDTIFGALSYPRLFGKSTTTTPNSEEDSEDLSIEDSEFDGTMSEGDYLFPPEFPEDSEEE